MGKTTIEWTDETWNPVRGCKKVSPGCDHCYAERFAERWRGVPGNAYEAGFDPRFVPEALAEPLRWRLPRTVFVNSMSDLFQGAFSDEQIASVFGVMAACPQHTFQVLTKRQDRLAKWFAWVESSVGPSGVPLGPAGRCNEAAVWALTKDEVFPDRLAGCRGTWPLPNVWLGVSVEDQAYADLRIPKLLAVPAAVRFVSYEPALGPVDFRKYLGAFEVPHTRPGLGPFLDWVIMGGESGPGAREMMGTWVRMTRNACDAAGVPFFFKQWGGLLKKKAGRLLDGRTHDDMPRRAP